MVEPSVTSDPEQNLYQLSTGIGDTVSSLSNLNSLFAAAGASPATYNLYVELVGMPVMLNEMSAYVQYGYE
jgi:hypothetical protein